MDYSTMFTRKFAVLFPDRGQRQAVSAVHEIRDTDKYEKEADRARLAMLKLTGSDPEQIRQTTVIAKQDDPDVLAWTEYPQQGEILKADREEYESRHKTYGDDLLSFFYAVKDRTPRL